MEQDGVGDIELDVNHLSDGELAQKLRHLGADIGPITGVFLYNMHLSNNYRFFSHLLCIAIAVNVIKVWSSFCPIVLQHDVLLMCNKMTVVLSVFSATAVHPVRLSFLSYSVSV